MKTQENKSLGLLKSEKRYTGIDHLYHVAYYRAARVGYQDVISRSLHDFKDGCEPQTGRWINLAAPMVSRDLKFDIVVRALGSKETLASEISPLDHLCEAAVKGTSATYAPGRLTKTSAVQALTTLGGRTLRQQEIEGKYLFDANELPESTHVLVVDDLVTTGATLDAITKAIRSSLPKARISCFVLARVDAQLQNTHLDPDYFLHGTPPKSEAGRKSSNPSIPPMNRRPQHASTKTVESAPKTSARKGLDTRVYVVGLVVSLMLLGATVLIPRTKDASAPPPQFIQLVAEKAIKSQEPIPERRAAPATPDFEGKTGVVSVPSMGLRLNHSLESKIIPKTKVRSKEHVEILRKFSPQTGPDWIQVRTKLGTVGWVMSSVVKEIRG